LAFDEKMEKESLAMDESSIKAPIQMDSSLVPPFEETIEVLVQVKEEITILMFLGRKTMSQN